MSVSTDIKSHIAEVATLHIKDELVFLQNPDSWRRIRKFKNTEGMVVFDFEAVGTEVVARVRENNGVVIDVALMTHETLLQLHISQVSFPGRDWSDCSSDYCSNKTKTALHTGEFIFGMAKSQDAVLPCLLISPAAHFAKNNELWPDPLNIEALLPDWLKLLNAGEYQTTGQTYNSAKEALIDRGFIESDVLTTYHANKLTLKSQASSQELNNYCL